jgi:PST family polysaccharide transporter
LFFFRAAVSLYTVGNVFILGLFVAPQQVAYYAGAERLTKAFLGLLEPLNRTFLPRLSHLVRHNLSQAARLAQLIVVSMGLLGLLFGGGVVLLAPLLVHLLLGPGFEPAIPLMRILALLLPLIAVNLALGLQWMVALGLDRAYNYITVGAGLLNIGFAIVLVPLFFQSGMAWAVVSTEVFVAIALVIHLHYSGKAPWQGGGIAR